MRYNTAIAVLLGEPTPALFPDLSGFEFCAFRLVGIGFHNGCILLS
jgi:hypothetical protein